MARAFDDGMNSSTRSPTRGVNRTIESMWSIILLLAISPSYYHHCGSTRVVRANLALRRNWKGARHRNPSIQADERTDDVSGVTADDELIQNALLRSSASDLDDLLT